MNTLRPVSPLPWKAASDAKGVLNGAIADSVGNHIVRAADIAYAIRAVNTLPQLEAEVARLWAALIAAEQAIADTLGPHGGVHGTQEVIDGLCSALKLAREALASPAGEKYA